MKICVSFKEKEIELYEHVCTFRDKSAYIKDLIEADMKNVKALDEISKIQNDDDNDNLGFVW